MKIVKNSNARKKFKEPSMRKTKKIFSLSMPRKKKI